MAYSGRFVAENEGVNGVCKLLIAEDDTILGAHVLGNPASEIITLAGMAIELKLTVAEVEEDHLPTPHGFGNLQRGVVITMIYLLLSKHIRQKYDKYQ